MQFSICLERRDFKLSLDGRVYIYILLCIDLQQAKIEIDTTMIVRPRSLIREEERRVGGKTGFSLGTLAKSISSVV